ncbi:hypothetical protein NQ317_008418 [Molorchus minor]|uniref:THAP-type domain-containing protein n=1 Tax=Molorchus minor TaxID=1323400 RepID=A0ABQ9J9V2_9CUCU|nr:hypothetical protein NQ317_008418 [Molorchus minor]
MNSLYYKYCLVPQCKSTTIKTPNKLFIYVPNNEQIRKKWLKLARRDDAQSLSTNSRMYFCADHFDASGLLGVVGDKLSKSYDLVDILELKDLLPLLQSSLCYYVGVYKNVACYPIPPKPFN